MYNEFKEYIILLLFLMIRPFISEEASLRFMKSRIEKIKARQNQKKEF